MDKIKGNILKKTIGVLTGGGDCSGLNAAIRAVVKTAINDYGMDVIGFKDGYLGLVESQFKKFTLNDASGLLTIGGTILGTSNKADPFNYVVYTKKNKFTKKDMSKIALKNYKRLKLSALICIGGDGTLFIANKLSKIGLNIVGIPKTIDSDLCATDVTIGFNSAVAIATDAIDKLHSTAMSHHRVMIIEVMGRYAGWLALESGIAGGGDIILIPEIPYDIKIVCQKVLERHHKGKRFSIIVVAEGAKPIGGNMSINKIVKDSPDPIRLGGIGTLLGNEIEKRTGLETRATILGHLQRGGIPTAYDRVLATRLGREAVHLAEKKLFGIMVALKGKDIVAVKLEEAVGKLCKVECNSSLIAAAKSLGVSFGIKKGDI